MLWALCGCQPDEAPPTIGTATAPDTAADAPLLPIGTECNEVVHVAGLVGTEAVADPHEALLGLEPDPRNVHLGWPGNDPSTSISFLWRTDSLTRSTVVEYGVDGLDQRSEGYSFLFGEGKRERLHEVRLCGRLEPGRTYQYRVGGDGVFSPIYSFTTPAVDVDRFRVGFLGDSRGAYESFGHLLQAMETHDPDFIVFSGDAVPAPGHQSDWDGWFRATGDLLTRKVVVMAHGNHESLAANYFAQFGLPGNEEWFTVRYGTLHLVVLNDSPRDAPADWDVQTTYIDRSFAEATGSWRWATHHQGVYATCNTHRSNLSLRTRWAPAYDRHGVDLVVNGHNHLYERSIPVRGDAPAHPGQGTTYVTLGGAGAPLYTSFDETAWHFAVARPVHHFGIADVTPEGTTVSAYDLSQNLLDRFVLGER